LMKSIQRIVIRTQIFVCSLTSNRLLKHPAKGYTVNDSSLNSKSDNPATVLVHHYQHPVRPQYHGFASQEIHTPKAVFHIAEECQPRRTPSIEHRSVMHGQDSTNRILINRNAEGQGDLLGNPRTAPRRI